MASPAKLGYNWPQERTFGGYPLKRSRTISVVFSTAAAALLLPLAAQAQGIGAKYGARNPHDCATRAAPQKGAISPAQAKQYFQCDSEKEIRSASGGWLALVTDINVQVGSSRPFMMGTDDTGDNTTDGIDPHFPVYPIRGSFINWSCYPLSSYVVERGKNCTRDAMPHATGLCFMSSFHEWHCHMTDFSPTSQRNQAPPQGD